jgi:hypothetical protein
VWQEREREGGRRGGGGRVLINQTIEIQAERVIGNE